MIDKVAGWSCVLAFGILANVAFTYYLVRTWKLLRQVKLYLVVLAIGNWVEIWFSFAVQLGQASASTWQVTDSSCKFLLLMSTLGESLAAMAMAALSLHLLLTVITGGQGSALRHASVIGLFTLLSTAFPLYTVPLVQATWGLDRLLCVVSTKGFWEELGYQVGGSVALTFFPLLALVVCWSAAACLFVKARSSTVKADEDKSDFVIVGILGLVLLLCCVPFHAFQLSASFIETAWGGFQNILETFYALMFLNYTRNALSAISCVVFAYVYTQRQRCTVYSSLTKESAESDAVSDERQKLVN